MCAVSPVENASDTVGANTVIQSLRAISELVPLYRSELSVFRDLSNIISKSFMHWFPRKKRLLTRGAARNSDTL